MSHISDAKITTTSLIVGVAAPLRGALARISRQIAALILALGALLAQPVLATDDAYVVDPILLSAKVVSSTQTDYTYSVRVLNTGEALKDAAVYVTSRSSSCRVIDSEALLGDLPRGSTVTSTGTVTIRRSRPGAPQPDDLKWTVRGTEVDTAPVAHAGPDQTVRIGTRVTLDGTASTDAEGERLFYHWKLVSKPTGSAARLSSVTAGRPTFTVDKRGTYVFRLWVSNDPNAFEESGHCRGDEGRGTDVFRRSVSDDSNDSDEIRGRCGSDEVRVSTINSAPVANAGPDRTVPRASKVTLDGTGSSDPDLDPLTYAWSIVLAPTGSTAQLSDSTNSRPTITLDKPGSYRFSLTVSDGTLSSRPAEVVITTVNSIPVANAGVDQLARIGVLVTLNGTASSDADNDPLTFAWTWLSTPIGSGAILRNANQPQPNFTPDLGGLYVIQLIVNDGFANSVPHTTTVTVEVPVNHPPQANPDTATTLQDTPVIINVLANDTDPDVGDILTIASFTQPASGGTVVQVPGGLKFTPAAGFVGIATFTYVVSDGQLTATGAVTVTVTPVAVNQPPSVNAGANQIAITSYYLPNATVALAGTVTDDGLPAPPHLTIAWSTVSGPGNVTFSAGNAAATSASFDALGVYVLRLTASDREFTRSSDVQVTVQVPPNTGPTLSAIADRTQGVGIALSLRLTATDKEPLDKLTFTLASAPAGATITPQGRLSWTPTSSQLGPQSFNVSVQDAGGLSDTKSFVVTVVNQNLAPILGALNNDTAAVGISYSKTITGSDPNGDALTFDLVEGPAGMTMNGNTLAWVPTAAQIGDATVKVRVRDPAGASAVGFFKVTVIIAGVPIAIDDTYSVKLGELLNIAAPGVLSNDTDPNGGTLTAIKRSDPAIGTLSAFSADGSFTYQAPATNPKPPFAATGRILTTDATVWEGPLDWPVMGDLDRDGKPDLITTHFVGSAIVATSGGDGHRLWAVNPACRYLSNGSSPTELLADIDDDGRLEYVFTSDCPGDNAGWTRLQALADDGQTKWTSEPLTKPFYEYLCTLAGVCNTTSQRVEFEITRGVTLAVARLGANEAPTIMLRQYIPAQSQSAGPYVKMPDGSFGYKYYGCRIATGLDADMGQECMVTMLISPIDGSVQQVLRSPVRNYTNPSGYLKPYIRNAPQAVDLDGDGAVEIVSGADVWKRVNGVWTLLWQAPFEPQQVAVVDLDGSGKPQIVYQVDHSLNGPSASDPIAGFSGFIIYDHTGIEQRRIPLPLYFAGMLTVADVDGDNLPEFLMVQDGYLHVINADGSFKWTYTVPDHPVWTLPQGQRTSTITNVQVYDLDGDGNKEVIFSSAGWLHILDGRTGAEKVRFDVGRRQDGYYGAAWTFVTDWDNDGHADILSVASGTGNISDPGSFVITAANNDWLPAGKYYGETDYRPSSIDDSGHVLFDPSVQRSVRNAKQLGTVRDPRVTAGTSFDYVANNGTADSAVAKVFLAIAPPNSPPVFTSRPPTAIQADGPSPFVYQAAAFDADAGDTITYSVNSFASNGFPQYATVDANTGAVSLPRSPAYGAFTVRVTITATDSLGASAIQSFVVSHVTAAPVAIPSVIGSTLAAATQALNAVSLQSNVLQEQFSAQAAGTVIAQSPLAASSQPLGTTVLLTVSKGLAPVFMPNVVGKSSASASGALTTRGFTVAIIRVYSSTIPAGRVISQSPVAGGETVPGPATVTVSLGTGLNVKLSRDYTNANVPATASIVAVDINGVESPFAGAALSIATAGVNTGALPSIAGSTITPAPDTQGTYRVTATDAANGRVGSADFVVTSPASADINVEAAAFADLSVAIADVVNLMSAAQAAGQMGDPTTMIARTRDAVTRWRALDQTTLRLSTPFSPQAGMPPRASDMAGFGVTPIPDDALNVKVLENGVAAVQAMVDGLRSRTTPYAQLHSLLDTVSSTIEPLPSLAPGEYGLVQAQPEYAYLASLLIPDWIDALMSDMARATGLPALASSDARPSVSANPEVYIASTLGEQLTTLAVNTAVEELNVVQQFQRGIMQQATSGALLVSLASHLRGKLGAAPLEAVVGGASLSILRFRAPYSMIEGIDLEDKYPVLNDVVFLGPDTVNLVSSVLDAVRTGIFNNTSSATKLLSFLFGKLKGVVVGVDPTRPLDGVLNALTEGSQPTKESSKPCIFSGDPRCVEMLYSSGFYSVYTLDPHLNVILPAQLSGLPIPIIIIARNRSGQFYLATPSFVPYREGIP